MENLTKERYEYNLKILAEIFHEIFEHPELRFNQIVYNMDIVGAWDTFYDEPRDVYDRIIKSKEKKNG